MSDDLFLEPTSQEASLYDEEALVAWTSIPLVLTIKKGKFKKNYFKQTFESNDINNALNSFLSVPVGAWW